MDNETKKAIEDKTISLINKSNEFQEKFTYYILAIDAACIGFAVTSNKIPHFSYIIIPFVLAILMWLTSLFCGIKELLFTDLTFVNNVHILQSQLRGNETNKELYYEAWKTANDKVVAYAKYKIWFLYSGTIAFILWYFLQMIG